MARITKIAAHLTGGFAADWRTFGRTSLQGYAFADGESLLEDEALARYLNAGARDLEPRLRALNGAFAVVMQDEAQAHLVAATDRIRSYPLFFGDLGDTLFLSDDAEWVAGRVGGRPAEEAVAAEFLLQGMTSGSDTLAQGVRQLRAGEMLTVRDGVLRTQRYYAYGGRIGVDPSPAPLEPLDRQRMIDEGIAVLEQSFRRMLRSIGGRAVAIPLSGGMDSRLVAFMLKRLGARDVRCFSYGRRNSFEVKTSAAVADQLGFAWRMVPYSSRRWHRWYNSDAYQTYRRRSSTLTAIEHEQDWPAVLELKEAGWLPEGAVFVPGHSGDMVAGSHLPEEALWEQAVPDVAHWIWRRYFRLLPKDGLSQDLEASLRARIQKVVGDLSESAPRKPADAARLYDQYGWQERQAKMIINSVRVYEHHGFGWRLPLWDAAVMDFWPKVPVDERYGKRLYLDMFKALMGPLADLPAVPPKQIRLRHQMERFLDYDLRRYGMYLGPSPVLSALRTRVPDLVELEAPWLEQLVQPIRNRPPQWISINGMIALFQWQDTVRRLGGSR